MLYVVVGRTGSGKSLFQAYTVRRELDRILKRLNGYKWYDIYTRFFVSESYYDRIALNSDFDDGRGNFTRFKHSGEACICHRNDDNGVHWCSGGLLIGFDDLPELYGIKNLLVMCDEAGTRFSNYDWDKMPEGYRLFLTAHRHNITMLPFRFDIYIFTQHKEIVDINLRRVAERVYLIRPLFRYTKIPGAYGLNSWFVGYRMWVHWEHELLKMQPIVFNTSGKISEPHPQDKVESLEFFDWKLFFSFFGYKNRYLRTYNTYEHIRDFKREKKK